MQRRNRKLYTREIPMPIRFVDHCKKSILTMGGLGLWCIVMPLVIIGLCGPATAYSQSSVVTVNDLTSGTLQGLEPAAGYQFIEVANGAMIAPAVISASGVDCARLSESLKLAASHSSERAQLILGYLYEQGLCVHKDFRLAMSYYTASANQGNAIAANNLGAMYEWGRGKSANKHEAARWYFVAATQGSLAAQQNLAALYFFGKGIRRDYVKAAFWIRQAADQGSATAQAVLAYIYSTGKGVPVDIRESARWAECAAEQGDPKGEAELGSLYEQGKGVPLDYVRAYHWYTLSFTSGNEAVKARLDSLSRIMTPRQINEANEIESPHP
jgi:hypothetical protein